MQLFSLFNLSFCNLLQFWLHFQTLGIFSKLLVTLIGSSYPATGTGRCKLVKKEIFNIFLWGKRFLLEYVIAAFKASLKNLPGTYTLAYFGLAAIGKKFYDFDTRSFHRHLWNCRRRRYLNHRPGKSTRRGRLSTVGLLVLTCLDQLLFILKVSITFLTRQATSMRRSAVLSLLPQLVFPAQTNRRQP